MTLHCLRSLLGSRALNVGASLTSALATGLVLVACSAGGGDTPAGVAEYEGFVGNGGSGSQAGSPGLNAGGDSSSSAVGGTSGVADPVGLEPTGNNNLPIENNANAGSGQGNDGAGGSAATSPDDGSAGSGMMAAAGSSMPTDPAQNDDPTDPNTLPDPPPAGASQQEIAAYFASLPCGAKYTAMGDGGWQFCLRLSDGGAACTRGASAFERVTFAGGAPVTNVAQVSGWGDGSVGVVTTDGALLVGGVTNIDSAPKIASGVVNFSGGYHAQVALVEAGQGFGVQAWTDGGQPQPLTLPGGAQPVQVSANYGLACALAATGDVYCWDAGGNHGLSLTAAPSRLALAAPVRLISVGQNSVCGVTFDDRLECEAAWYDNPFLPTEPAGPGDFQVRQATFASVREVHAGFAQGVIVRGDGQAFYLPRTGAGSDNAGEPFNGVSTAVASGGDRGAACVQEAGGAVFCHAGGTTSRATLDGAPLQAQAAACPL